MDVVIKTSKGDLDAVLEVTLVNGKLSLNTQNANYSFGSLHKAFQRVFRLLKIKNRRIDKVLILGFGAGSVAEILHNELNMDCKITGVEKDYEVIRLAEEYFGVRENRDLQILHEDAFDYMLDNERLFDLVVVDLYVDRDVPGKFESVEFLDLLEKGLNKNGLLIFNKMVYDSKSELSAGYLKNIFFETFENNKLYSIEGNQMLVAFNE